MLRHLLELFGGLGSDLLRVGRDRRRCEKVEEGRKRCFSVESLRREVGGGRRGRWDRMLSVSGLCGSL